jgi:hypothetical protein
MTRCTCEHDVCAVHDAQVDAMLADVEAAARFHRSVRVRVRREGGDWRNIVGADEDAS